MEKIPPAIKSCKVFLLLVSLSALVSEQVKNEMAIANDRIKYGMKIVGIILDDSIGKESLNDRAEYMFTRNQLGYWSDAHYQSELEKVIHEYIVPHQK